MDFCPNMRYTAKYVFQVRFVFFGNFQILRSGMIFGDFYSLIFYLPNDVFRSKPILSLWCNDARSFGISVLMCHLLQDYMHCILPTFLTKTKKVIIDRLFAQLFPESHEGGKNVIVFFDTYPQQRGEEVSKKIFIPLFPSIWAHNHYHASIPHVNQRGHQTWHVKVI